MINLKKNVLKPMALILGVSCLSFSGEARAINTGWSNAGFDCARFVLSESLNGQTPVPALNKAASYISLGNGWQKLLDKKGWGDSFVGRHGKGFLNLWQSEIVVDSMAQYWKQSSRLSLAELLVVGAVESVLVYSAQQLWSWAVSTSPAQRVIPAALSESPWAQFIGRAGVYTLSRRLVDNHGMDHLDSSHVRRFLSSSR